MSQIEQQSARSPFLPITIFLALGIFIQRFFDFNLEYLTVIFLTLPVLILLILLRKTPNKRIFSFLLLGAFLLIGAIRFEFWTEKHLDKPFINNLPIQSVEIQGSIQSMKKTNRIRAVFNLEKISRDSLEANTTGKILLYFPINFSHEILPGQILIITDINLEPLPKKRNPGQFDYANYLRLKYLA